MFETLNEQQNKCFDPSTPSMRKVDNGGQKKEKIMLLVTTNFVTSPAISNGHKLPQAD